MIGFRWVRGSSGVDRLRRIDGSRRRGALLLCGLLLVGGVDAAELTIYRCETAEGSVALQDQPCPANTEERTRQTRLGPDSAPLPRSSPQQRAAPASRAEPAENPRRPPPALWQCIDLENRSRYADRDDPRGRWVPAWVVGADPRAPMRMFRDVGRPKPPPPRSGPGGPGGTVSGIGVQPMVYVEDWCRELDARSACRAYRDQARAAHRLRGNRVGDERDAAAAEAARLDDILEAHCG